MILTCMHIKFRQITGYVTCGHGIWIPSNIWKVICWEMSKRWKRINIGLVKIINVGKRWMSLLIINLTDQTSVNRNRKHWVTITSNRSTTTIEVDATTEVMVATPSSTSTALRRLSLNFITSRGIIGENSGFIVVIHAGFMS